MQIKRFLGVRGGRFVTLQLTSCIQIHSLAEKSVMTQDACLLIKMKSFLNKPSSVDTAENRPSEVLGSLSHLLEPHYHCLSAVAAYCIQGG